MALDADEKAYDLDVAQFGILTRCLVEIASLLDSLPPGHAVRELAECARRDLGRASQALLEAG